MPPNGDDPELKWAPVIVRNPHVQGYHHFFLGFLTALYTFDDDVPQCRIPVKYTLHRLM